MADEFEREKKGGASSDAAIRPNENLFQILGKKVTEDPGWKLLVLIFELAAVLAALWALYLTYQQTSLAQEALRDQRVSSAWQILANSAGGNYGQSYALETLISLRPSLTYVDLSCSDGCNRVNDFTGITIDGNRWPNGFLFEHVNFSKAIIDKALISDVVFRSVNLMGVEFEGTKFHNVALEGIVFSSRMQNPQIDHGSFRGVSFFNLNMAGANIKNTTLSENVNISDAMFCVSEARCGDIDRKFFEGAWFHQDHPPKNLRFLYPDLVVLKCGNGHRVPSYRPYKAGRICEKVRADQI